MNRWCIYQMTTTGIIKGDTTSAKPTERQLQSCGGIGWAGGQDLRCVNQIPWVKKLASISLFQDYLIIPRTPNFQRKSSPFPTSFKTISNKITSHARLLKNFNQVFKKCPPLKVKIYKLLMKINNFFFKIFFLQICNIFLSSKSLKSFGNLKGFSKVKSQKVGSKGQNTFPKCQSFLKSNCFPLLSIFYFRIGQSFIDFPPSS